MSGAPFVSYAQNGEDVVLWRALRHIDNGRYVDVGANDPVCDSVTKAFYDRGWTGINIEPMSYPFGLLREDRPNDINVAAAVTTSPAPDVVLHEVPGTGLSTLDDGMAQRHGRAGHDVRDVRVPTARLDDLLDTYVSADMPVHFLKVDVEGSEADVLATLDLKRWRPWVLVVEATQPNSTTPTQDEWEPDLLASGYAFCLFDGISRFYVAEEHADLAPVLSYPACTLDAYVRHSEADLVVEREALLADLIRWRGLALRSRDAILQERAQKDEFAALNARLVAETQAAHQAAAAAGADLHATRATLSWRVTKPLRAARRFAPRPTAR